MARPMATRWRWPPESWPGLRSSCSSRPSILAAPPTSSLILGLATLRSLSANPMLLATVMCG